MFFLSSKEGIEPQDCIYYLLIHSIINASHYQKNNKDRISSIGQPSMASHSDLIKTQSIQNKEINRLNQTLELSTFKSLPFDLIFIIA